LPAYPGAALFLGCVLENWCKQLAPRASPWLRRGVSGALLFSLLGCLVGWGVYLTWEIPRENALQPEERFAKEVRAQCKSMVLFFRAEAHDVAFHMGPPIATILEWENLDAWLLHAPSVYVIMPKEYAEKCPQHLHNGKLQPVLCSADFTSASSDRPLVLLRSVPN
jgi:hypothetical protein